MKQVQAYFYVTISQDQMSAKIHCTNAYDHTNLQVDTETLHQFLYEHKIMYGIDKDAILFILSKPPREKFPMMIARGTPAKHGIDGKITYMVNFSSEIERSADWNFREVMQIPSVRVNQKLATNTLPTKGKDGTNVCGRTLRARRGKSVQIKAGENVEYRKEEASYYSTSEGQVSVTDGFIKVHNVFEVNETLSMKTGNLDFVGSIIIRGDVPTGYTVRAEGDIKVFGIVEAAEVIAGGSVYITGGLAGLKKGSIKAEESIHIGYINQGFAHAEDNIYVENSIIHGECKAGQSIFCQRGNIIGGTLSAIQSIEAKDIGNRLNTQTIIKLGNEKTLKQKSQLLEKKAELDGTLKKIITIGKQLESQKKSNDIKIRTTIMRQRNSQNKILNEIKVIDEKLVKIISLSETETESKVIVRNNVYPNVIISFGKYKHQVNKIHHYIKMKLEQNEIVIRPI